MKTTGHYWQASEARNNFPELMKRALSGKAQIVRHRNGEEVVVLSRQDFEATRPTLREFLLKGGPRAAGDNDLERIISKSRAEGIGLLGRWPTGRK
jgi:prevent-host-death family protein